MTCLHCGTETAPTARFCATCGAPQQRAAAVAAGVLTPLPDSTSFGTIASATPVDLGATTPVDLASLLDATQLPGTPPVVDVTRPVDLGVTRPPTSTGQTASGATSSGATASGAARQTPTLVPGLAFGSRYHIIRLLGVGGMGAVYHAWDEELGVAVALKVIRADVTSDPQAAEAIERRFKRELLLARQVTHKHVVRIHDLGDIDGVKYITMPYVQGSDLASVLRQAGKLPIPRALAYTRQIVDGLVAAHDAGVVHRDLKPANIMINEDDQALIMDFGIARSSAGTGSGTHAVVGTLAYMAPEQAKGQPTDQRADVYALGMMLAEMLVGRRVAADGQQAVADLMARMNEAPPRVRAIDSAIPEPLDALVARCVEPDPAKRFQTSADLAQALGELDENGHRLPAVAAAKPSPWRLVAAAAVVVVAIGLGTIYLRRSAPASAPKPVDPVSILVADFDNKTGDAVFDGALEQPLTIAMEGASFINTYSRRDALKLAQTLSSATKLDAAAARPVAFREGVKYVLAGSVASSGGQFQLQVDAVDPATGKVVKTASATAATKGDVLSAVGTLAAKIRTGLGDTTSDSAKLAAAETFTAGSIDAMREYSTAQDLQVAGQNEEALVHYRHAIDLDPKFGRAYAGAANINFRLGRQSDGEALFKQALSLMDRMTDREKHRTLGSYYAQVAGNPEKSLEEYSALVKSYPADAAGHANLAVAYFNLLDFTKALEEGRQAVKAYPKNLLARNNLALFAMYAGDFPGAAAMAKTVAADNPAIFKAWLPIAMDAVAKGDTAAAVTAYDDMSKTGATGASLASLGRADLALYAGRLDAALAELKSGMAVDLAASSTSGVALKQIALAEEELAAGRRAQAVDAAHEALKLTRQLGTIVPTARVLLRAGKAAEAKTLAGELEGQLQKQNRAYGKILLAEIALEDKKTSEAVDLLNQARPLADVWLGRFDLGIAYVEAGAFAEALPEFEACEKRRGEATALFLDDKPTVRYLATLPYWLGRAQEGLNMSAPAKAHYAAFLALKKDAAADPLVQDAHRRAP